MSASLSASGLVPMSAAIAGSEVAITVESMFSMNRATATISGTMRLEGMGELRPEGSGEGKRNRIRCRRARRAGRHCGGVNFTYLMAPRAHPGRLGGPSMIYILALFVPPLGLLLNGQPFAAIFNLVLIVPSIVLGSFSRCSGCCRRRTRDRGQHEARGPQAPRAGRGDRAARAAAGLATLSAHWTRSPLLRPLPHKRARAHSSQPRCVARGSLPHQSGEARDRADHTVGAQRRWRLEPAVYTTPETALRRLDRYAIDLRQPKTGPGVA